MKDLPSWSELLTLHGEMGMVMASACSVLMVLAQCPMPQHPLVLHHGTWSGLAALVDLFHEPLPSTLGVM
jgi:hypothetical protein